MTSIRDETYLHSDCTLGCIIFACRHGRSNADVFTLEGPVETNAFRQANFKWALPVFHPDGKVTPKFVKALALGSDYLTKIITPTGRQA